MFNFNGASIFGGKVNHNRAIAPIKHIKIAMSKQTSKWIILIILSSSIFLSVIDIFIVNVAIPAIKKGIHGTDGDIQLVIALYLLGYAAF
ncbi:hypothetical protein CS542_05795 [Pedobacter sp. IW39]|nr:hypothetical protein CS542_05795 [Pedobacter sp. IW39]